MQIDFRPIVANEMKYGTLAQHVTKEQLIADTKESIGRMVALLDGLTDADVVFEPKDEKAHDAHATKSEEVAISWNLAHIIVHVTASSEEGGALGSLLARGIEVEMRPRYETPWREITTVEQCRQRLEESRRMRLAYFETWPDTPHLDVFRKMSPRFEAWSGPLNAIGSCLMGLGHEVEHYDQMVETRKQAVAAAHR